MASLLCLPAPGIRSWHGSLAVSLSSMCIQPLMGAEPIFLTPSIATCLLPTHDVHLAVRDLSLPFLHVHRLSLFFCPILPATDTSSFSSLDTFLIRSSPRGESIACSHLDDLNPMGLILFAPPYNSLSPHRAYRNTCPLDVLPIRCAVLFLMYQKAQTQRRSCANYVCCAASSNVGEHLKQ